MTKRKKRSDVMCVYVNGVGDILREKRYVVGRGVRNRQIHDFFRSESQNVLEYDLICRICPIYDR